jgi:hypothetical protein
MTMLPTVIYLLEQIRRMLKRSGRHLSLIAEVLHEAMHDWRAAARKYPFTE